MTEERKPDQTDDPRQQGTGQGRPETNIAGDDDRDATDEGPDTGASDPPAPDTSGGQDEDAGGATGNPNAAGG